MPASGTADDDSGIAVGVAACAVSLGDASITLVVAVVEVAGAMSGMLAGSAVFSAVAIDSISGVSSVKNGNEPQASMSKLTRRASKNNGLGFIRGVWFPNKKADLL